MATHLLTQVPFPAVWIRDTHVALQRHRRRVRFLNRLRHQRRVRLLNRLRV